MSDTLEQQAIQASLTSNWKEAVILNNKILKKDKKNVNALNRLACAFFKLSEFDKAIDIYQNVLKFNPYSSIARKNLKRIASLKKHQTKTPPSYNADCSNDLFLNEPGTTRIVALVNPAPLETLSCLTPSQRLCLINKKRTILCLSQDNQYIGALPDDLSFHLIKLTNGGNSYSINVHSVMKNTIKVLIKEIHRSTNFKNQASFI